MLAYDGTDFHGWQVQPGLPTVQGALADAIHRITGEVVLPQGSGRTDAGVHAEAQVASFALASPIPAANLLPALNRILPSSVRVVSAEQAPDDFHARHSARGKTYEYRIHTAPPCSPMLARYVYACPWTLDVEAMREAARAVLGNHDFTSFAAVDPDRQGRLDLPLRSGEGRVGERGTQHASCGEEDGPAGSAPAFNLRTIVESRWERRDGLLLYTVRGNGFLHHMVRNLVGTLVEVGRGRFPATVIANILSMRDRSAAGPTAPASGLFLKHVDY